MSFGRSVGLLALTVCLLQCRLSSQTPLASDASPLDGVENSHKPEPAGASAQLPEDRKHSIELSDPPEHRWDHVIPAFATQLQDLGKFISTQIPKEVLPIVLDIAGDLDGHLGPDFAGEIRGVARMSNLSVGMVFVANVFYELNSGCTSVVACSSDGKIIHGRNLDYFLPLLTDLTVELNFTRNGKLAYRGVGYAGMTGLVTALRPDAFSVSLNQRDPSKTMMWGVIKNALEAMVFSGAKPASMMIRESVEQDADYTAALFTAQHTTIVSPCYLIYAGLASPEGAIVTRDRNSAADVLSLDPHAGRWYLLQTNYDHWKQVPKDDDRRHPGYDHMNNHTAAEFDTDELMSIMSMYPTLNSETTYTSVMSPTTSLVSTVLRNVKN